MLVEMLDKVSESLNARASETNRRLTESDRRFRTHGHHAAGVHVLAVAAPRRRLLQGLQPQIWPGCMYLEQVQASLKGRATTVLRGQCLSNFV